MENESNIRKDEYDFLELFRSIPDEYKSTALETLYTLVEENYKNINKSIG